MRNSLIDERGSYKAMAFKSKTGIWRLIASESNGTVMDTLDTFTDDKFNYKTMARREIDKLVELGHITAII